MKVAILIFTLFLISCNSSDPKKDADTAVADKDSVAFIDSDTQDEDKTFDTDSSNDTDADNDSEKPDVDMYCPLPMDAKYPYFREDGTIHFCRPCDTPDEYDPQCVKSLWKDLNKEVYDKYKNGEFEDNEYIAECYPWPCEWKVEPTPNERVPLTAHQKCDKFLNPRTWANDFGGQNRASNMDDGKIAMQLYNYRYSDVSYESQSGRYTGKRTVLYNITSGKYTVIGKSVFPFYINGHIVIDPYITVNSKHFSVLVNAVPYKESYKYEVIYTDEDTSVLLDSSPYITDKWTIMVVNHLDDENDPMGAGTRELIYSKTGEWKWTTLAHGNSDGKAGELSIAGDKAIFAHIATNTSYICDLSKSPKSLSDCKKISREGESAGFPKFDRDNPNRIIYRSIVEGGPANKMVVVDISKEPWKIEREFEIPSTETAFLSIWLMEFKSNVILYEENYVMNESGYQEDGKLCYYRIDKGKTYCSKPIENQTSYGHGYATFENKYLFWQPMYKAGYILRDMECYCKEEGVCPFEE